LSRTNLARNSEYFCIAVIQVEHLADQLTIPCLGKVKYLGIGRLLGVDHNASGLCQFVPDIPSTSRLARASLECDVHFPHQELVNLDSKVITLVPTIDVEHIQRAMRHVPLTNLSLQRCDIESPSDHRRMSMNAVL
jgi:hypothetical protein